MKRLLIYITILTTLFSGGIALTSAMGKTAPPPAFAQWFTTPDGSPCPMPCVFGIRPGVTKWDEVEGILKAHPLLLDLESGETYGDNDDISIYYFFQSKKVMIIVEKLDPNYAMAVTINSDNDQVHLLTFKQAMEIFGYPQTVSLSLYNQYHETSFTYRNETLLISIDDQISCRFKSEAKVTYMSFYAPDYVRKRRLDVTGTEIPKQSRRWLGFSRYDYWQRYYADSGEPFYDCAP